MKLLSTEKSKVLAEQYGWSLDRARGFVDGEACRRLGKTPPRCAVIGIDNYALGFRAGYFERQNQDPARIVRRSEFDKPVDIATARMRNG